MATTYTELVTEVTDYAIRSGDTAFVAMIPTFIKYAEVAFNRRLRIRQMEQIATVALSAVDSSGYLALPTDFLEYRSVAVLSNPVTPLEYVTPQKMRQLEYTVAAGGSTPAYFTVIGSQMRFYPNPGSGTSTLYADVVYYAKPTPLSATNATNNILNDYPDLYLHATLLQAYVWAKDADGIQLETAAFEAIIKDIKAADVRAEYPGMTAIQTDIVY
jgi:hypothetical protein